MINMKEDFAMKKLATLLTCIILILTITGLFELNSPFSQAATTLSNPLYDAEKDYAEWDCIYFGRYPQDSADKNDMQPIKWRVLSVENNIAMLMSDKSLFAAEYTVPMSYGPRWETSYVRFKISDFFSTAFANDELKCLQFVDIKNEGNPKYPEQIDYQDTTQKVYILSYSEACNPKYGFCEDPEKESKTRMATTTIYALCKDGNVHQNWWLRTQGKERTYTTNVLSNGAIDVDGTEALNDVDSETKEYYVVRPVIHIDISNTDVWSYAGRVTSEDELEIVIKPTSTPVPTVLPIVSPTVIPTSIPVPTVVPTKGPKIGETFRDNNSTYKIVGIKKEYKAVLCKTGKKNKNSAMFSVPDTVVYNGITYNVTAIDANAFKGCNKLKKVVIGKNIRKIGKKAFYRCKQLKKVTVESLAVKNVGKKAFKGIHKKAIIRVHKSRYKQYKILFEYNVRKIKKEKATVTNEPNVKKPIPTEVPEPTFTPTSIPTPSATPVRDETVETGLAQMYFEAICKGFTGKISDRESKVIYISLGTNISLTYKDRQILTSLLYSRFNMNTIVATDEEMEKEGFDPSDNTKLVREIGVWETSSEPDKIIFNMSTGKSGYTYDNKYYTGCVATKVGDEWTYTLPQPLQG